MLAVNVRLYNNRLRGLRLKEGLTAVDLCRRVPMCQGTYGKLEKIKASPKTKKGEWQPYAIKLAEFWKTTEDHLFPSKLLRMRGYEVEFEVNPNEIRDIGLGLSQYSREMCIPETAILQKELCSNISRIVRDTLCNETDYHMFKMRFIEGLSLEEISTTFQMDAVETVDYLAAIFKKLRAKFIHVQKVDDSYMINLERVQ